jgi:hypothetical protein
MAEGAEQVKPLVLARTVRLLQVNLYTQAVPGRLPGFSFLLFSVVLYQYPDN